MSFFIKLELKISEDFIVEQMNLYVMPRLTGSHKIKTWRKPFCSEKKMKKEVARFWNSSLHVYNIIIIIFKIGLFCELILFSNNKFHFIINFIFN